MHIKHLHFLTFNFMSDNSCISNKTELKTFNSFFKSEYLTQSAVNKQWRVTLIFKSDVFTSYSRSISEDLAITLLPQATGGGSGVMATVGEAGSVFCCWGVGVDGRLMTGSSSSFWELTADWSSIVSLMVVIGWVFSSLKTRKQQTHAVKTRWNTDFLLILLANQKQTRFHVNLICQQDNTLDCMCVCVSVNIDLKSLWKCSLQVFTVMWWQTLS